MSPEAKAQILKELNSEQQAAVTHGEGPLLIVAGAGTGKTTVITRRIAWLIEQGLAKPEEILALTFTDKASQEMEERVDRVLPMGYVNVWVSTFHAFGERVLQDWGLEIGVPNNFRLLTQAEQWMLVRNNLSRFHLDYYRPLGNPTRFIHALLQHFSRAKDEEVYPDDYLKLAQDKQLDSGATEYLKKSKAKTKKPKAKKGQPTQSIDELSKETEVARLLEVAEAYKTYQDLLHKQGVLDFGDLINYTLKLFRLRPRVLEHYRKQFKYILVDEFQDTNYAQYELLKLLAAPANNITVVGDDDQSIYKFRGASISNILEFKQDYPQSREVFLTVNYRSYQNILDTAYEFIQLNNPYRLEVRLARKGKSLSKKLVADRTGTGEVEHLLFGTGQDEAEGVVTKILELQKKSKANWSDFAILVRANAQAQFFLQALRRAKLPHTYVANRGLYAEDIIVFLVSYLKLLDNYHESEALYRVLAGQPFALSYEDLSKLSYHARKYTTSLFEALKVSAAIGLSEPGVVAVKELLSLIERHTVLARGRSAAEVYVTAVNDLGVNERLQHPAAAREAQLLTAFYQRLQRYEADTSDRTLVSFMRYLELEMESGEEGELPPDTEEGPETVKVITVHSAKGLEWRYVFIVQLVDRRFPSVERREAIELPSELIKETLPEGDVHLQEERRLFYVGLTRARDGLFLTRAHDYFGKTMRRPSRFLVELGLVSGEEVKAPPPRLTAPQVVQESAAARFAVPESFSFSSISAFKKCPLEFKYRYLLRLPEPGAHPLSFGSTIHKTLELFLKLWQQRARSVQADLFGGKRGSAQLPSFEELKKIYASAWVDEWYPDQGTKQEYRDKRGPAQLKNFYDVVVATPPKVKYLEQFFKIGLGPYKFVGKVDRMDEAAEAVAIIDYKTGAEPAKGLEKVDRDQLTIYQIAAEEFFREQVVSAKYWYLQPNSFSPEFVASPEQVRTLKGEYAAFIKDIIQTIETDSFAAVDESVRHDCRYRKLGLT
ncbi:MAG: ATP-dependent DNA helicase [Candidatus Veblenbacteria bacterium]|nr:ATP-dependent DNA helicase [Candidatus Veblenbacteria bacterium]